MSQIAYTPTPAAREREAERLRHMARRASNCYDVTPCGMARDKYAERLERQALEQIAMAHFRRRLAANH